MERYRVVRIEEQMYGCEELPEGAEVCCDVTVEAANGHPKDPVLPRRRADTAGIDGEIPCSGTARLCAKPEFGKELEKERNIMKKIETSASSAWVRWASSLAGRCPA